MSSATIEVGKPVITLVLSLEEAEQLDGFLTAANEDESSPVIFGIRTTLDEVLESGDDDLVGDIYRSSEWKYNGEFFARDAK